MRAIIVSTSAGRAALAKLVARLNAREGYPRDGVNVGGGVHATAAQGRTLGYAVRAHHTRTGERALLIARPRLRLIWEWVKARIAERKAAGTADADDLAIDALADSDLPADWTRTDTIG